MFAITQTGPIPQCSKWIPMQSPTSELLARYEKDLSAIQTEYKLLRTLNPNNFRDNQFTTEIILKVVEHSRTITRKLDTAHSIGYYTYLELYRKIFTTSFINRIKIRYEEIKNKAVGRRRVYLEEVGVKIKGVPLRSFHALDDGADSSKSFRIIINYIESETGSSIAWNHLSTYTADRSDHDRVEHVKNRAQWIKGVDGDGFNPVNSRAWKNNIITVLKNIDMCVVNSVNAAAATATNDIVDPTAYAIGFILSNLNIMGTAIISLQLTSLIHTEVICMIHLFSLCFDTASIIHTSADDRLFLCGADFKGFKGKLPDYQPGSSCFTVEYMNSDAFTKTVEDLINIIRSASEWRLSQYKKMFTAYSSIADSTSAKLLRGHADKILDEYYPDESKHWTEMVGL